MEGLNDKNINNNAIGGMTAAQLQTVLNAVLGMDGINLPRLLARDPTPRELSLVKVEPFKGTEAEDPYEWMKSFENAARANNWTPFRCVEIIPGVNVGSVRRTRVNDTPESGKQ